jgi:hypothetical protein
MSWDCIDLNLLLRDGKESGGRNVGQPGRSSSPLFPLPEWQYSKWSMVSHSLSISFPMHTEEQFATVLMLALTGSNPLCTWRSMLWVESSQEPIALKSWHLEQPASSEFEQLKDLWCWMHGGRGFAEAWLCSHSYTMLARSLCSTMASSQLLLPGHLGC